MDAEINDLNFLKYGKLVLITCTRTMIIVYKLLYNWPDKCPHKLANHLCEIPVNQLNNKPLKKLFTKEEITKFESMMADEAKMEEYDISFFYKLIQYATNNDKIKHPNDDVWSKQCPDSLKKELEHLLFLIKEERNEFSHFYNKFFKLKDNDIETFCDTLLQRLPSIIQKVGLKVGTDSTEIKETCDMLRNEIETVRIMKEISSCDEMPILKTMIENDLMSGLNELKRCFREELKNYCPPNFNLENRIISAAELLSDDDSQLICINAETGFGKTSFTKFVQLELLSKIEDAGDDLASLAIPIRIACRDITGRNVSEFLEDELPFSRHCASSTSSLKKFVERFNITWIIDGYDERTGEFSGFFQSLLKTLPSNHKIIITSRPHSLDEIKDKFKNKKLCYVSIECFADQKLEEIAMKCLEENTARDFVSSIKTLNSKMLNFVKIPINLILCLELWTRDNNIFDEKLTTIYQLYDMILKKHIDLLVSRHKDKTNITSEKQMKINVMKWFSYLCKIVAESAFDYELSFSQSQEVKLIEEATSCNLIGELCLSTFLKFDGINYFIQHKTQKEVLVCDYLKRCDNDVLKSIAQQNSISNLLNNQSCFHNLKFIMSCCNKCEFVKIFTIFLEIYPRLHHPDCFLQIKDENEEYFNALKKDIKDSHRSLVLRVNSYDEEVKLLRILQYLMTDVNSFTLEILISSYLYEKINDFIYNYKDKITFNLKFEIYNLCHVIPVIQMFTNKGNNNLIEKLDLSYFKMLEWDEEMKEELFKLENLKHVSFKVNCNCYSSSFLFYFAKSVNDTAITHPVSAHLNRPQTPSSIPNLVTLASPTSMSLGPFDQSCHVHFTILNIEDPSEMIADILKINQFQSISIDLKLYHQYLIRDLDINLLQSFLSSSVQVKNFYMCLDDVSLYPNLMKIVNHIHVEILILNFHNEDELKYLSNFKEFFQISDFDKLKKMKEIYLCVMDISKLILIYNEFPSHLIDKATLHVKLLKSSDEMYRIIDESDHKKQFKQIRIENYHYLSASEIAQLRSISKSLVDYWSSTSN